MEKRKLGTSTLLVSPIIPGGNVFGWTLDEAGSFKILAPLLMRVSVLLIRQTAIEDLFPEIMAAS